MARRAGLSVMPRQPPERVSGAGNGQPAAAAAARATRTRSVSNVSSVAASSNVDPADLLELVVVAGQVAADGLHEEVVDRLVDPRPVLHERVLDLVERPDDVHREAGLLGHLAESRLLGGLADVRRPLGQGPGNRRRVRAGVCRRPAAGRLRRSGGRDRPRRSRSPLQARHAGATEARRGPGPRSVRVQGIVARAAAGKTAASSGRLDHGGAPWRAGRSAARLRARARSAAGRGHEPGPGAEPEAPLTGFGRRMDVPRGPSPVECGDAVLHARIVPRHGSPCKCGPEPFGGFR